MNPDAPDSDSTVNRTVNPTADSTANSPVSRTA